MHLLILAALAVGQGAAPVSNEVTIYNQGFALVKELRTLNLKQGRQTVDVENVAALIEPQTVGFRSVTDKDSINVLEQNYQYDLISPTAILQKSVGSKVRFIRVLPNSSKEVVTGTLISLPTAVVNNGVEGGGTMQTYNGMVIRTDDGRILLNPTGEIEVTSIPEGLITRPTLLWDLESSRAGENSIELSYITQGMTWNADYVFTLSDVASTGDLQGWVTLNNNSGATYNNVALKLLAGNVNQVPPPMAAGGFGGMGGAVAMNRAQFQEQGLFEYHLYTLQRPTTLHDKETKQVSLLEGHGIKYEKILTVDSLRDRGYYTPTEGAIGTGTFSPQVRIEFVNSKENGLGMPLPEGTVRMYQRDSKGSVQMIGEDHIDHTPKDEKLSLVAGKSFDVVAERLRLEYHKLSDRSFSEVFQVTIRNHKDVNQPIVLLERHYADWNVTKSSDPFTKPDANTMKYVVDVPANGNKVITYSVTTTW